MSMMLEQRLRPFRTRLRLRRALDIASRAVVAVLALECLLLLIARTTHLDVTAAMAVTPPAAVVIAIGFLLRRAPGTWDAALAADRLGLDDQATSAMHGARVAHPAAAYIETRALGQLEKIDRRALPVLPDRARARWVLLAAAALVAVATLPLPGSEENAARAADRAAIAEARDAVEEIASEVEAVAPEPVREAIARELDTVDEALSGSDDRQTAAESIERAQERVAALAGDEQYAARRTLDALAAGWDGDPQLGELAAALRERESDAIATALASLEAAIPGLDEAQQTRLELALQAGANNARELPALAGALREAAASTGELGQQDRPAIDALGTALAGANQSARGLAAAQAAISGLGQARAGLGPASGSSSRGQQGSAASGSSRSDQGSGQGTGSGSGQGNSAGSSSGQDQSSAAGAGQGSNSGQGAGAGAGGGPAPGIPSGQNATGSGGGQGRPNQTTAQTYDRVFDPTLIGGGQGAGVSISGGATNAQGETVDLPDSPLALGAIRPYNEVFGNYQAAARQALSRSPLPPALADLVQEYFSAIAPAEASGRQ